MGIVLHEVPRLKPGERMSFLYEGPSCLELPGEGEAKLPGFWRGNRCGGHTDLGFVCKESETKNATVT